MLVQNKFKILNFDLVCILVKLMGITHIFTVGVLNLFWEIKQSKDLKGLKNVPCKFGFSTSLKGLFLGKRIFKFLKWRYSGPCSTTLQLKAKLLG